MYETREGKSSLPQEPETPSTAPSPETQAAPAQGSPLKQIRTFQGDVASALKDESLFSIQRQEQVKRASQGIVAETEEDKNRRQSIVFAVGGLAFVILGIGGAWLGYLEFTRRTAPPAVAIPQNRFISVQEEIDFNFASSTRDSLLAFVAEKGNGGGDKNITHLVMREGSWRGAPLATTAKFLEKLGVEAPGNLVRAFNPLFMLGTIGSGDQSSGKERFIIITINSFQNAYPGMLAWEARMPIDIGDLFTTGPVLKTIPPNSVFKDIISKNKDVRVLGTAGSTTEPLLLYSFFDNRMLIITESLETLQTLIERLNQELLSR